jgi:hypothetical protein
MKVLPKQTSCLMTVLTYGIVFFLGIFISFLLVTFGHSKIPGLTKICNVTLMHQDSDAKAAAGATPIDFEVFAPSLDLSASCADSCT